MNGAFGLKAFIWPVRGCRSHVWRPSSKPYLTPFIIPLINWWASIPRSSSLTCHKPRPDPHSHSNMLPCDSAHHDGPHTHSSTKDRPAPAPYWLASSWWTAALRRSSSTFRETGKAEKNWGWQLVYTLQPHPLYILYSTANTCFNGSDFRFEHFIRSWTMWLHYRRASAQQSGHEPRAKKKSSGFNPSW